MSRNLLVVKSLSRYTAIGFVLKFSYCLSEQQQLTVFTIFFAAKYEVSDTPSCVTDVTFVATKVTALKPRTTLTKHVFNSI
jgi:hypothetical protein